MAGRTTEGKAGGRRPGGNRRGTAARRPAARKRAARHLSVPHPGRFVPGGRLLSRLLSRPSRGTRLVLTGILGLIALAAATWIGLAIQTLDRQEAGPGGEGEVTIAVARPAPRPITGPGRADPPAGQDAGAVDAAARPAATPPADKDAIGALIQELEAAHGDAPRGNPEAADAAVVAALPRPAGEAAGDSRSRRRDPGERDFGEAGFPRIAIVIDDLGGSPEAISRLMALPGPVSYAFLTANAGTPVQAKMVATAGLDVMLHMPMEPEGKQDPGPNALLVANSPEENLRRLRWHLARLPLATGVNNHMGSRFTADGDRLRPVLAALRDAGLFWLDSRTSGRSVGYQVAKDLHMRAVQRDIFLDHEPDEATILAQLRHTEEVAAREGYAIAIGHPYPETLAVLERWMPKAQGRGFVLVGIADLLPGQGAAPQAMPQDVSGAAAGAAGRPARMSN